MAAPDAAELERRVAIVRRAFGDVRLHRPLGDQLRLFVAGLPGQRNTVAGYDDVLTPEQMAALMPLAAHTVGSDRGFLLGHTLSGCRRPVRLNLREGSDENRNAAILSIGALGTGKTTLDQKLAYEAFLLGARVIDCDPKGDHRLHELPEVAPHVETIALRGDRALRGMLDPLRIAPEHLRHDATVSFLRDLLPARPRRHGRPRSPPRSTRSAGGPRARPAWRWCGRSPRVTRPINRSRRRSRSTRAPV